MKYLYSLHVHEKLQRGKEEPTKKTIRIKVNDTDFVEDDLAVKVLGWWLTVDGHLQHHINKIKGTVCQQLAKIKPYVNFLSIKERREFIYSKALSIAGYGLEFFFGQTQTVKDSISVLYMRGNTYAP